MLIFLWLKIINSTAGLNTNWLSLHLLPQNVYFIITLQLLPHKCKSSRLYPTFSSHFSINSPRNLFSAALRWARNKTILDLSLRCLLRVKWHRYFKPKKILLNKFTTLHSVNIFHIKFLFVVVNFSKQYLTCIEVWNEKP